MGRIRQSKRCLFCPSGGGLFAQVLEGKKKKAEKCISQQQHFLDARLHDFFCATAADTMQTSQLGTSWNLHMHTVNTDAQWHSEQMRSSTVLCAFRRAQLMCNSLLAEQAIAILYETAQPRRFRGCIELQLALCTPCKVQI